MGSEALAKTEVIETASAPAVALAVAPPATGRAIMMREAIDVDAEQRAMLKQYIEKNMIAGVDYGKIPGTPKPTLLKPGAEKLVDLFRVEPHYESTKCVEDWDRPLFHYEFRCVLKDRTTGTVYAVGVGSCNSMEGRYRWRNGDRLCPECGVAGSILRSKKDDDDGWFCWKKKNGCGANFEVDDERITGQVVGKVPNDDVYSLVNTILKMAKKRAQVDAAIALARCSDIFTQDVEDGNDGNDSGGPDRRPAAQEQRQQRKSDPPPARGGRQSAGPAFFVIPFGKNRGKKLGELSPAQLQWYAECDNARVSKAARDLMSLREQEAERAAPDPDDTNGEWGMGGDPDAAPSNGDDTAGAADPGAP